MTDEEYFVMLTEEKSQIFGKMFALSASEYGWDSIDYIRQVMTSESCENMVYVDERTEWCDEYFLAYRMNHLIKPKKGKTLDDFTLWFIGYTYKYWMRTRNLKPKVIYSILPVELFLDRFPFYHTQGFDYVINDATRKWKESKKQKEEK